ncbi:MAG: SET domain-containing protein-lysine N-methyltransferase [Verrucomicrobia bacterium]|nr:SET domain-containing protein-lysine N-methyltransferase [Verrucomicrobiota bacterium]
MGNSNPIAFESEEDAQLFRQWGLEALERGQVSEEALRLGKEYRKEIEEGYLPKVLTRRVEEIAGDGLFADEEIAEGAYVGEYTGVLRRNDLRRYFEPLNPYCYQYPLLDELGKNLVIDAKRGNATRLINHSDTPNLKPLFAFLDGYYRLIFLALRRIERGEQLFYDYGKSYWFVRPVPVKILD